MSGNQMLLFLLCAVAAAAAEEISEVMPNCPAKCGNVSVPYPFGFGEDRSCYKDLTFKLICNDTKLLFVNLPVLNISLQDSLIIVKIDMAFDCYNSSGNTRNFVQPMNLTGTPFTFSNTRNKFIATGCDTMAVMSDNVTDLFSGSIFGCISSCGANIVNAREDSSCSGVGCCQIEFPKGQKTLRITVGRASNRTTVLDFNPCSRAFLADTEWFKFSGKNLTIVESEYLTSNVVLDWVVREKCEDVGTGTCGPNSHCNNSESVSGHHCYCDNGYKGNPYLPKGCQDIDECLDPSIYSCEGTCKNTKGNYTCSCPFGKHGDGKVGCRLHPLITVFGGIGAGILVAIVVLCVCWVLKLKIREKYFRENGGILLEQHRVKIFKEAEVRKATNNYNSSQLLGEGGNGSVYKGLLENNEVAIKKSKVVNKHQIVQFLNEVEIVSQINHKNVVKLLGLCLDDKVPLLVYEYISNGTLFHHIHDKKSTILNTWKTRLKIAAETAGALDYIHSKADPPIIHRDVKSTNILIDSECTAKVADFGASMLIPFDRNIAPSGGQGTFGYIDPEYLQTGKLTKKSDVYSFGVVLMELLTRERPISNARSEKYTSLVTLFLSSIRENYLDEILKVEDVQEHEMRLVYIVAKLAEKCVAMPSTERPTMTEVADVLDGLTKECGDLKAEGDYEETQSLLEDEHFLQSFEIYSASTSTIQ